MGYLFDAMQRSSQRTEDAAEQDATAPASAADATVDPAPAQAPTQAAITAPKLTLTGTGDDATGQPTPTTAATSIPVSAPLPAPMDEQSSKPRLQLAMNKGVDDRLVAALEPSSLMAEEYRAIRTGILARWKHRSHLVHTITSATPQEGKTITSLNLGLCFAELHNRRTVVVEADLRLPQFSKLLNLPARAPGLVDVLRGRCRPAEAIQEVGPHALHVIAAGKGIGNEAVQLLSGKEMAGLLKSLRSQYDHVIIDTPPVVELADAGILGALSDDVLLIVRLNRTPKPLIEQAITTLASYNAPAAGLIATDQHSHMRRYYQKYGYSYRYSSYAKAA